MARFDLQFVRKVGRITAIGFFAELSVLTHVVICSPQSPADYLLAQELRHKWPNAPDMHNNLHARIKWPGVQANPAILKFFPA
jgi:hypothetical protein